MKCTPGRLGHQTGIATRLPLTLPIHRNTIKLLQVKGFDSSLLLHTIIVGIVFQHTFQVTLRDAVRVQRLNSDIKLTIVQQNVSSVSSSTTIPFGTLKVNP